MEQERERERQSLDSSRPSMESSSSRKPVPPTTGLSASGGIDQKQASNENLIEPGPSVASPIGAPSAPFLKQQEAESDQSRSSEPTEIAGFQSMVDTAFDHAADNSVPATPATTTYSHRAVQDISRSNTDSTSDISPIMSRVPSSGNADSRGRAAAAAAAANLPGTNTERVSTIAEEVPADTSKGHANPQRPRSGASFGEINRPEVTSPSPQASPARSPRLETDNRRLSQALAAEISQDHNEGNAIYDCNAHAGGVSHGPPHDEMAPTIQADDKRVRKLPSIEALQKQSSRISSPLASPVNGRTSPFPGRVRDLAGKYNEIHEVSRRNSQMSLESKRSYGSLGRNEGSLRLNRVGTADSLGQMPVMDDPSSFSPADNYASQPHDRPSLQPQASFRPALPGEWISTSDFRQDLPSSIVQDQAAGASLPDKKALPQPPTREERVAEEETHSRRLTETDHHPSTEKSPSSPIDALKAAGAALGESLRASVGSSHQTRDFASHDQPPVDEPTTPVTEQPRPVAGDVLLRPLHFDRTASSVVSSVAPTPPAKDSPRREGFDHEKQYFEQTGETSEPQDRALTNSSLGDPDFAESDRLREAIVRSLSPNPAFVAEHQPVREQTVAPSFDSLDIHHPQTREENGPSQALLEEQAGEQTADLNNATLTDRPALLSQRFSWENRSSAFFNPSGLGAEVDLPQGDLHVINPEPASPPIESGLHDHSIIAESPELRSTNDRDLAENHLEAPVSPVETTERVNRDSSDMLSSPVVDRMAEPPNFPSAEIEGADNVLPRTSFSDPRQTSGSGPTRIPPFREILAIKNPTERISTYNSTRKQFAEMNTGLRDWLSVTMAARPEHDHLTTAGPSLIPGGNVPDSIRHRPTQSIVRLAKGLGSSSKGDGPSSPSTDNHGTSGLARKSSNNYANHSPQSSANVEKMQAIGKDFLSSAGKLGGKSVVGAKGWLAKGRQKLRESSGGGGDKVD